MAETKDSVHKSEANAIIGYENTTRPLSRLQQQMPPKSFQGEVVKVVPVDQLSSSDLHVDAVYQGGRKGNAGDDPLPTLMRVDSQGGFRYRKRLRPRKDQRSLHDSRLPR